MRLITILTLVFLVVTCAQISPITGGERDVFAPSIVVSKSLPKNGELNFKGNEISLKFNEFIKLNKVSENIIITPQLSKKPTVSVHNKTFSLEFNEELEENTTYVVNFNGAIQDITERNDSIFQYVFSTGNYIDSISVSGSVKDSYTNKAVKNCFIAIYPHQDTIQFDSIPYELIPTYIGQTNDEGEYKIDYLKNGSYSIFTFTDRNKNMKFDSDNEKIGFRSDHIIQLDSNITSLDFRIFEVDADEVFLTKSEYSYPGKFEVVLNKEPESFTLRSNVEIVKEKIGRKDSMVFWLTQQPVSNTEFYYTINGEEEDTLVPYLKNQPKEEEWNELIIKSNIVKGSKLLPNDSLIISIDEPILNVDDSKFHFLDKDSNEVDISYQFDDVNAILFHTHDSVQFLQIDSAAIESVFGNINQVNTNYTFENLESEAYFGQLFVKFDSLDGNYLFELLDSRGELVKVYSAVVNESKTTFDQLPPGKYQLRVVEDLDNDKKWTKGSVKMDQQSERVFYYTDEIKIRSKWDLEIEMDMK